jgi:tetratricopeptide (TPR) repeat protein
MEAKESAQIHTSLSFTCNNIGIIHMNRSKHSVALEYYLKALEFAQKMKDKIGLLVAYYNVSYIYSEYQKDRLKAIEYLKKAVSLAKDLNSPYYERFNTELKHLSSIS